MQLPFELVEQIERKNVVLILGHDINLNVSGGLGPPTMSELAQDLAERSNYSDGDLSLARVAQFYELEFGRHALISYVRERLYDSTTAPLPTHHLLARLPFRVYVTTCFDDRLEQALQEAGRPSVTVIRNADIAYEDEEKALIVKMYGDFGQPDSLVLTEMDHRRFLSEVSTISDVLNRLIASRTLLLLGYDLDDNNFKDLYDRITRRLDRHARRSYAFYRQASSYAVNWWGKLNNVRLTQAKPAELLPQLEETLRQRRAKSAPPDRKQIPPLSPSPSLPISRRPYKFLNAFQAEDTAIFFGRNRETSQFLSKIMAYRLVLFYGKSGVGKTSLLQAGVAPALAASGYHPVYTRILDAPPAAIIRAVNAILKDPLPEQTNLHDYLQQAAGQTDELLVLIIDQFEELFTQIDPQSRAEFVKELGAVYADEKLKLKIVLSFREDFLAELNVFTEDIPAIFHNYRRLQRLTPQQARQAIVGPAELCGFSYEPKLVTQLVVDLGEDKIDPPQLQIVCDSLYEALGPNEKLFTLRHYAQLGGASAILSSYLDQVLKRYVSEQRATIQGMLKAFVTSADTKAVLTVSALAHRTKLSASQIQTMLDELLRARLVRRTESETHYELAHEYLADHIATWISEEERNRQRAREMLEQGLIKWERFGLHLYRDELAVINNQREDLDLDEEAAVLLARSAVRSGLATDYWLEQIPPRLRTTILGESLNDEQANQRQQAARLISRFKVLDLKEELAELILNDTQPEVRCEAALNLARLDQDYFVARIATALESTSEHSPGALEAIASVQDAEMDLLDYGRLDRFNLQWRLRWLRLTRNRVRRNWITLYAALGGAGGGLIGGLAGAITAGVGEQTPVAVTVAIVAGLLLGTAFGFGFGTVEAMGEPRNSFLYIVGSALSEAVAGIVFGAGDARSLYYALVGAGIGLVGGLAGGGLMAMIIGVTEDISSSTQRLAARLVSGLLFGTVSGVIVSVSAAAYGVLPYGFPWGIATIALIMTGIVGALEFADRKLAQKYVPPQY